MKPLSEQMFDLVGPFLIALGLLLLGTELYAQVYMAVTR
jgi:hypothetical protein